MRCVTSHCNIFDIDRKNGERMLELPANLLHEHYNGFLHELRKKRPETRNTYDRALREFLRWSISDRQFFFGIDDVGRYKDYLTNCKQLSQASVSTYLTALRRFCQYLIDINVLNNNPAKYVSGYHRPVAHSRSPLKHSEIEKLLSTIKRNNTRDLRDFIMIKIMLGCGLSEIELVQANIGDIQTLSGTTFIRVGCKKRRTKDISVPIPKDVREAINKYIGTHVEDKPDSPLFLSAGNRDRGKRMTARGIRKRINYYLTMAGIKNNKQRQITPHSLCHTAALLMVEAGASPLQIQERMRLGSLAAAMMYVNQ